jgi:hypothetical protein
MTLLLLLSLGCREDAEDPREGDNPGECTDGADNDADGFFDCDDNDCFGSPDCGDVEDTGDIVEDPFEDKDGDGYSPDEGDCDDNNDDVNPGAVEICNNVDDDCNGEKDDSPVDGTVYYEDADGDTYGTSTSTIEACDKPSGYSTNDDDCDDDAKDAHPGGIETDWDGVDQDCDGYDVNIEACVTQSVADATDWVSWWSYTVPDNTKDFFGLAGYDITQQVLYVDADSHDVTAIHGDPLNFDVEVDSQQALNHTDDAFWADYYFNGTWYYCDGYIDWTQVLYNGGIQLSVSGQTVTAQVDLTSSWDGYVQDDIVLWNTGTGGQCDAQTIDDFLDLASTYTSFNYDLLSFFDAAYDDNANEVADELETEIAWYIEYNCSN